MLYTVDFGHLLRRVYKYLKNYETQQAVIMKKCVQRQVYTFDYDVFHQLCFLCVNVFEVLTISYIKNYYKSLKWYIFMIYRFKICQKYTKGRRHVSRKNLKQSRLPNCYNFISLECLTQVCFCDNKPCEGYRDFVDYVLSNSLDASLFRGRSIKKINNQSKSRKSSSCDHSRDL